MMRTIFSFISIALAAAIFFVYTMPTFDTIKVTNDQIAQYDQALDKAAELEKLKEGLLERYKSLNPSDIDKLQKMLPDHVDNIALIMDIDNIASHYGMSLQNVDISAAATAAQGQIGDSGGSAAKYQSTTMKFGTVGTYNNFLQFLNDLQSSLRIVDVTDLSIAQIAGNTTSSGDPLYQYQITINTYWLK